MPTLTTPVTVTLFTEARAELLEQLAAAQANLTIARDEMERIHRNYLIAVDLVISGDAAPGTADLIYADFEQAARTKRAYWYEVDALKTQLLNLPDTDEAAALDNVKASLNAARLARIEQSHFSISWFLDSDNLVDLELAKAHRRAAIALSKQVVAHLPR